MKYIIDSAEDSDGRAVNDIFNHYVKSSFAAYPEESVPYQSFELLRRMAEGYPSWSPGTKKDMASRPGLHSLLPRAGR